MVRAVVLWLLGVVLWVGTPDQGQMTWTPRDVFIRGIGPFTPEAYCAHMAKALQLYHRTQTFRCLPVGQKPEGAN
jgi:hypothetical protein